MSETAILPAPPAAYALSDQRRLRFATLFLLYVAQGLPFGLFDYALPAWLAQGGGSAAAVGTVLAMVSLPWTFKLAYGFVMDRYGFLAMGRRRPWIIFGQLGMLFSLLAMAFVNPGVQEIGLIAAFAFALGMTSAIQDVAVDGLAVDILPATEIEQVNGLMFGGQAIGIAMGGALSGMLLAYFSLPAAALALAAMIAMVLLLVLTVREREGERLLPWTRGAAVQRNIDLQLGAFLPIVRNLFAAMANRRTLILIPAFMAITASWGIFLGLAPLYATNSLAWGDDLYSSWSSQANLVAGLAGGLLFGLLAGRWGAGRMFIVCAALAAISAAVMLGQADGKPHAAAFIVAIFTFNALAVLRAVVAGAIAMRLCSPAVAATQFAVFMAILNIGRTLGGAALGPLEALGGISAMYAAMVALNVIAIGFVLAARLSR